MQNYLNILELVLEKGIDKKNRTGIKTRALFGLSMRFNLENGFPAITTKKLFFKSVKAELLWFISGSSDVKDLQGLGCRIWNANAKADYWLPKAKFDGDLGRVYGVQWRSWKSPYKKETIDQLKIAIEKIKHNPTDRRIIVSAWNPAELDMMALPPCHMFFQFFPFKDNLSLLMYQRSSDLFLGVPFNIASYSLLLAMVAQVTGRKPFEFIHILGDAHIYHNHFEQVKEQIKRKPLPLPNLYLNPQIKDIDSFTMEDIKLVDYQHHSAIKAEMAV